MLNSVNFVNKVGKYRCFPAKKEWSERKSSYSRNVSLALTTNLIKQNPVALPDAAFVQLLVQHQNIVHKICRAYCPMAEDRRDLFQEIALQLWRAYPNFRNEAKESTWIYRIAINVAISGLRKARPQSVGPVTEVMHQIPNEESDTEERVVLLYKAMYTLSDLKKALVLLYFEEKTNDEISELMGLTPNHIRVTMHRIREKLRAYFQTIHSI